MEKITEFCTGCRACEQLCGVKAISMKPDKEGFLNPIINTNLCIDCGLCAARCPQNGYIKQFYNHPKQTKAARLVDEILLYKAASGGVFAGVAKKAILNGWIVFGCRFDRDLVAHHGKAETLEELNSLLSSKYVQSDTLNSYSEVKSLLLQDKKVLYCGTGCQIGGLLSYLGKTNENLYTIDLVCHGVPSPLMFKKYIEYLSNQNKGHRIVDFDFRDKRIGWGLDFRYRCNNKNIHKPCSSSPYYQNFLMGNSYRECCYQCYYACNERVSDLTIADYWGIEYVHPEFNDERGVSLVLINTEKGQNLWIEYEDQFESINSSIDQAAKYNTNLNRPTHRNDAVRDMIYNGIQEMESTEYVKRRLMVKRTIRSRIIAALPLQILHWMRKNFK